MDFIWLFMGVKLWGYTFLAHNAKGYDGCFAVSQFLKEKWGVQIITLGGKLMCIEVPNLSICFMDSSKFLPMNLSSLPQVLTIEGCKGYSPNFF